MDRQTAAQAIAMLVMLTALARWLPPGDTDDVFGRGDPWRSIEIDRSLIEEAPESRQGAAMLRAMFRRDGSIARWHRLLDEARVLQAGTGAGDVIQLRGVGRNELWPLTYDLYPARVVGLPLEAGGGSLEAVRDDATWVLTLPGLKAAPVVERGPGAARPARSVDDTGAAGTHGAEPAR